MRHVEAPFANARIPWLSRALLFGGGALEPQVNRVNAKLSFTSLLAKLPGKPADLGQFIRYLLIGGWNTAFGYCVFAGFNYLLTGRVPYAYMAAGVISNIIAITVAYVGYKFFVFRTSGNYLREYLRFYVVYGASAVISLTLLPVFVWLITPLVENPLHAPYIAQALIVPIVVLSSFVGHKRFSFKARSI